MTSTFPLGGMVDMFTRSAFVLPQLCSQCSSLATIGGSRVALGDLAAIAFRKHDDTLTWLPLQAGDVGPTGQLKEISAGAWHAAGEQTVEVLDGKPHWYLGVDHENVRMVLFLNSSIGRPRTATELNADVTCLLWTNGLAR